MFSREGSCTCTAVCCISALEEAFRCEERDGVFIDVFVVRTMGVFLDAVDSLRQIGVFPNRELLSLGVRKVREVLRVYEDREEREVGVFKIVPDLVTWPRPFSLRQSSSFHSLSDIQSGFSVASSSSPSCSTGKEGCGSLALRFSILCCSCCARFCASI